MRSGKEKGKAGN